MQEIEVTFSNGYFTDIACTEANKVNQPLTFICQPSEVIKCMFNCNLSNLKI